VPRPAPEAECWSALHADPCSLASVVSHDDEITTVSFARS
jgi:hypothetical protein